MTKIAIVEDNKVIRESLAEFVEREPENKCVGLFATGQEAIKFIPKLQPDITLMDIQLPDISGIECTERLKQIIPNLQIIMVTVYEDTEKIFRALRAGACGYILKRCTPEELLNAIREVKLGGAPMSREVARKVISYFQQPLKIAAEIEDLSHREREILELLALGFPNKEIAVKLGVTEGTIRWHLRHIYHKLHVRSRTEAALKYRSATGDLQPPP